MSRLLTVILCGAVSYLLGAVPFGYLIARARGVDIRRQGSGNVGATNVFRCVGRLWGTLTLAGDTAKGFAAAFIVPALLGPSGDSFAGEPLKILCAGLAVAGHNWPVFLGFRGGKGVATSAGALLGIAPLAAVIGLLTWLAVAGLTRYVSAASMVAAAAAAVASWALYRDSGGLWTPLALSILAALVVWRHKANIRRLLAGTENRMRLGRRPASQPDGEASAS